MKHAFTSCGCRAIIFRCCNVRLKILRLILRICVVSLDTFWIHIISSMVLYVCSYSFCLSHHYYKEAPLLRQAWDWQSHCWTTFGSKAWKRARIVKFQVFDIFYGLQICWYYVLRWTICSSHWSLEIVDPLVH